MTAKIKIALHVDREIKGTGANAAVLQLNAANKATFRQFFTAFFGWCNQV